MIRKKLSHLIFFRLYEDQNENAKAAKVYETYLKIYSEEMVMMKI